MKKTNYLLYAGLAGAALFLFFRSKASSKRGSIDVSPSEKITEDEFNAPMDESGSGGGGLLSKAKESINEATEAAQGVKDVFDTTPEQKAARAAKKAARRAKAAQARAARKAKRAGRRTKKPRRKRAKTSGLGDLHYI